MYLFLFFLTGCSTYFDKEYEEFNTFDSSIYLAADTSECSDMQKEMIEFAIQNEIKVSLECIKFTKKES
jgi:hypothetical protein